MKRCVLAGLSLLLAAGFSLVSAKGIEVKSGNTKVLLNKKAVAAVQMDLAGALWIDKYFKDYCGEKFVEREDLMYNTFIRSFNTKSKGLTMSDVSTGAGYRVKIHSLDFSISTAKTLRVDGIMEIINAKNGKTVCVLQIIQFEYDVDMGEGSDAAGSLYSFTGENFPNRILRDLMRKLGEEVFNL